MLSTPSPSEKLDEAIEYFQVRFIDPAALVRPRDQMRIRIMVSVWAYAYEILDTPIVTDEIFDAVCKLVDLSIDTGSEDEDVFFRTQFDASTGLWVHSHPRSEGLAKYCESWKKWGSPTFTVLKIAGV